MTHNRHSGLLKRLRQPDGFSEYVGCGKKDAVLPMSDRTRAETRIVRVIKCLNLLQRACYSADDLAKTLGVSKRTIYRDLRVLAAADVPLARSRSSGRLYVSAGRRG